MFKTIKRIISWIGPYKKRLFLGTLCSFFAAWCTAVPIVTAGWVISKAVDSTQNGTEIQIALVCQSFLVIAISVFLKFLLSYTRAKLQDSIGTERAAEERIRIGNMLKRVSLGYFSKNNTGEILADLTGEFSQLELNGMSMINTVLNGYISFIAFVLGLFAISWQVAVVAVIAVLASALALHGINYQSNKSSPVNQATNEMLASAILEYVRGIPVVKSFGLEGFAFQLLKETFIKSRKINISIEKSYIPWNVVHLLVLKLASVIIVWITAWHTMEGSFTLPFLILMAMFAFFIFGNIEAINDSAHVLGMIDTALNKIEKIESAEYIDHNGTDVKLKSFDIKFEDVCFGYGNKEIIHNVSFTAKQNTTTAIVGPSGSGKTTLCNLMARFYDVKTGHIFLGGHDVREFTCDSLLKNFAIVFQNVYLFQDTIKNNISFGKQNATDEEIISVAKAACCHDFIMDLPEGYNTMVGEGGSTLSMGEKQRISIARAILKDAPIVILDEATASIDPENEHLIQKAISVLTAGKTIITIAHRLATIEQAEQILVLDDGCIAQVGSHDELIEQKGIYRNFVQIRERAEGWSIT